MVKTIPILACLLIALGVTAQPATSVKDSLQVAIFNNYLNPMIIHIRFYKPMKENIEVSVRDDANHFIHRERSLDRQYDFKFNTEFLPNGVYTIQIASRKIRYSKRIDIKTLFVRETKRVAEIHE